MLRGCDCRIPTAEQSPPPKSAKRKASQLNHHYHHTSRKEKLIAPKTGTESETETLTLTRCSTVSTATFTSHQIYRKQKHRRKRKRKLPITGDYRQWTYSTRDFSYCKDRVVFVSYNILGVENAAKHPDLYNNISPKYLDWDYRKRILHKEIKNYKPGVICFQEVDRFDDLDDLLKRDGFRGVYKARTGEASDGCAIFWNTELFTLLHEESIEFQTFGLRNNVSQLCIFRMNQSQLLMDMNSQAPKYSSSRTFLVGNVHVLFNPSRGDIKLGQMRLFLEKAHKLSQEWGGIPVVIAGDLNSMPQSAMYQFLTSSELDVQQHDRKQISGQICPLEDPGFHCRSSHAASFYSSKKPLMHRWSQDELRLAAGSAVSHVRHPLKLCSAYVGVPGSTRSRNNIGEPLATSYHSKFMGTVDYIWHTGELLPVKVLETLPINRLKETGGLPSKRWGSDHLVLACELAFADHGTEE
ncbi:carbon catabolite repressor protein 4 homolog 5 isoform X1 [Coffea arabica]|uniref:Carbon catabolite repressor protein 4 homolog 5 isoform X1 n=1 Tax=Coffea arabica TaxID=13443 RepID=A0A6P6XB22_COFAR